MGTLVAALLAALIVGLFAVGGLVVGWRLAQQELRNRVYEARFVEFEVVRYRREARWDSRPAMATGSQVGPKGGA